MDPGDTAPAKGTIASITLARSLLRNSDGEWLQCKDCM